MLGLLGIIIANASYGKSDITVTVAGATFPYPVYVKWADAYQAKTGVKINYQSIGSGAGIKQVEAKIIDFGASDKPLPSTELKNYGLTQFPTLIGGVAVVINVPGMQQGQLKLTGPVLANIFLGKIKKWNDSAIVILNPGVKLPDQMIVVVHRVDGSGTTFLFTSYLAKVSPYWSKNIGSDIAVSWPTGVGGKGNEGVTASVKQFSGSMGYIEFAYASESKVNYVQLQNQAGKFVSPTLDSFKAAAINADWEKVPSFAVSLINSPGEASWPITGATFILTHSVQNNTEQAKAVLQFFDWAYRNGSQMALNLNYVPLPENVVALVEKSWKNIKDKNGKPIW